MVNKTLGEKYKISNWLEASTLFRHSGQEIMELCKAALKQDRQKASSILMRISEIEEQAYRLLKDF
jgi:hypothetical protein